MCLFCMSKFACVDPEFPEVGNHLANQGNEKFGTGLPTALWTVLKETYVNVSINAHPSKVWESHVVALKKELYKYLKIQELAKGMGRGMHFSTK